MEHKFYCISCGKEETWQGDKVHLVELEIFNPTLCDSCFVKSMAYNRAKERGVIC